MELKSLLFALERLLSLPKEWKCLFLPSSYGVISRQMEESPFKKKRKATEILPEVRGECLKVFLRVRPILNPEQHRESMKLKLIKGKEENRLGCMEMHDSKKVTMHRPEHIYYGCKENLFSFTRVFGPMDSQETVFEEAALPLLEACFRGENGVKNGLLFAYGVTNSGKTFTMQGSVKEPGIIPRILEYIFTKFIDLKKPLAQEVKLSYTEIFNEETYDLLADRAQVGKKGKDGTATEARIKSHQEGFKLLEKGQKNRSVSSNGLNTTSSRSHSIIDLYLTVNGLTTRIGVVDLAGSERNGRTHAKGDVQNQGIEINKSLLALSKCLEAWKRGQRIPYRDSVLTMRLRNFFEKGRVLMIVNANPSTEDFIETLNALKKASVAQECKIEASVNTHRLTLAPRGSKKAKVSDQNISRTEIESDITQDPIELLKQVESLKSKLEDKEHECERLQQKLGGANDQKEEIDETDADLDNTRHLFPQAATDISVYDEQAGANIQIGALEKKLREQKDLIVEFVEQLDFKEKTISYLQNELEELRRIYALAKEENQENAIALVQIEERIGALSTKLTPSAIGEVDEVARLSGLLKDKEATLVVYEEKLQEQEELNKSLQSQLNEFQLENKVLSQAKARLTLKLEEKEKKTQEKDRDWLHRQTLRAFSPHRSSVSSSRKSGKVHFGEEIAPVAPPSNPPSALALVLAHSKEVAKAKKESILSPSDENQRERKNTSKKRNGERKRGSRRKNDKENQIETSVQPSRTKPRKSMIPIRKGSNKAGKENLNPSQAKAQTKQTPQEKTQKRITAPSSSSRTGRRRKQADFFTPLQKGEESVLNQALHASLRDSLEGGESLNNHQLSQDGISSDLMVSKKIEKKKEKLPKQTSTIAEPRWETKPLRYSWRVRKGQPWRSKTFKEAIKLGAQAASATDRAIGNTIKLLDERRSMSEKQQSIKGAKDFPIETLYCLIPTNAQQRTRWDLENDVQLQPKILIKYKGYRDVSGVLPQDLNEIEKKIWDEVKSNPNLTWPHFINYYYHSKRTFGENVLHDFGDLDAHTDTEVDSSEETETSLLSNRGKNGTSKKLRQRRSSIQKFHLQSSSKGKKRKSTALRLPLKAER